MPAVPLSRTCSIKAALDLLVATGAQPHAHRSGKQAGTRLRAASEALRDAGAAMAEAGMSLELGVAV